MELHNTNKTEYIKIDNIDQKIIDSIEPGIRYSALVKAVGLNKDTIRYRLFKLERVGLVRLVSGNQKLKIYPANYQIPEIDSIKVFPVSVDKAGANI